MSYSDFLNYLGYGVQLFYNTLVATANSLITNYIFITILGLSIFVSLVWFVFNLLNIPFSFGRKTNLDEVGDK